VYEKSSNHLSRNQNIVDKLIAKRQGKVADEASMDYRFISGERKLPTAANG
jgi:hypothetical protein